MLDFIHEAIKSGPVPELRDAEEIRYAPRTSGERVIAWAERKLITPEGPMTGQPVRLDTYQKMFIIAVFDNPAGTNLALLSIARRNGKTFLIAVILLAFICGPQRSVNISLASAANSREQAALAFDLMVLMLDMTPHLTAGIDYKYVASSKSITGLSHNVRYRAISAEAKSGHGKAYKVILLDEAGQIEGESTPFTDMLETSQSNYDDALMFIISTQAPSDSSYFSQQLDNAEVHQEPTTVSHVYAAEKDCDLMDKTQWYRSNPGLGKYRSLKSMAASIMNAKLLPSKANGVMNLNLNLRVSLQKLMLSPEAWKANLRKPNQISRFMRPIDIGLDLSMRTDLTAAVACWRDENGDISVETHAFAPQLGVEQRELRDKVPYQRWAKNGDLFLTPGPIVDYEWVCKHLAIKFKGCQIRSVQFDRYRIELLKEAAKKTDFYAMVGEWVEVGQGFVSMGIRVEAFEQEVVNGRLRTGSSPALNLGASQAVVGEDPAGNRKPLKNKSVNRIDALVAALMAVFPNSDGQVNARPFDPESMIG